MRSRSLFKLAVLVSASICAAAGCGVAPMSSDPELQRPVEDGGGSVGSGVVHSPSSPALGEGAVQDGLSVGASVGHSSSLPSKGKGFNPSPSGAMSSFQTEVETPSALACGAAVPIILNRDSATTVSGTTTGSPLNYQSWCGQTSMSPAVVYAFTLAESGTFQLTVKPANGSSVQPIIDIRTACGVVGACSDDGMILDDFAAGTYYLIIDGDNQTSGDYIATLSLSTPFCGDGVVNDGEACDPGAAVANDGCGAPGQPDACQFQPAPPIGDRCPGQVVPVSAGMTVLPATDGNSTYGFADDYAGSCGGGAWNANEGGGADRVYQIVPDQSGTMTVSIGYEPDGVTSICGTNFWDPYCWGSALYVRTTCDDTTSEVACAAAGPENDWNCFQPWSLTFPVTAGTPYFVFVDGYDNGAYSTGLFNLVISLQ